MKQDIRRRLEQYAANLHCTANIQSALRGIPMESVARSLGLEPTVGQSPFALSRGVVFERGLFEDDASHLRRALKEQKVLPANASGFLDLRIKRNSGPLSDFEEAQQRFTKFLRDSAKSVGDARMHLPSLIAAATLQVPDGVMHDGLLVLDLLTVHPQPRPAPITLRVGEIKVYPDRGGFTDRFELATARAQAGLYAHMLNETVQQLGLQRDLLVADDGFLVLTSPGSNQPSVRAGEDFRYQAERAKAMFDQLKQYASATEFTTVTPEQLDSDNTIISTIVNASKQYGDTCLSFCELAEHCQQQALSLGLPQALGEDLGRFLGPLTLHRALELLHGQPANNPVEQDFLRRAR